MADSSKTSFIRPIQQGVIIVLFALGIIIFGAILYSTKWIILATLVGLGLGVLVSPIVSLLKRRLKIPRGIIAFLSLIVILGITGGSFYLIIAITSDQITSLASQFPTFIEDTQKYIFDLFSKYPKARAYLERIPLGSAAKNTIQTLFQGIQFGATAIGGLFFILILALYYAATPASYLDALLSALPARLRNRARELFTLSGSALRAWFLAQLIAMLIVGSATAIGLLIIGVQYWLVIGLLFTVLDIVPYLGPFVAAGVAVVITLATDPDKTVWALGLFIIIQQLEGDLIIPLVMKGRITLPPIQLIVLMLVFTQWFGILGVLIAPPVLAILRTLYLAAYVPKMEQIKATNEKDKLTKAA